MTTRWGHSPYAPSAQLAGHDPRQKQGQQQHRRWSSYSPGGTYQSYPQATVAQMYRQPPLSAAARSRPISMTGLPLSSLSPYPSNKGSVHQHQQNQQRRRSIEYAGRPASASRNSLQMTRRGSPPINAGHHGRSAYLSSFNNAMPRYSLLNQRRLSAPAIHAKIDHSRLPPRVNANVLRKQTYLNPWKSNTSDWSTGFDYLANLTDPCNASDVSSQTSAKAFLSRLLEYVRQTYEPQTYPSPSRSAASTAISRMNQIKKLHKAWLPKGTVHASKIQFSGNAFAGHIDFEDSSSVWWRCKWPSSNSEKAGRRSSMSQSQALAGGTDIQAVLPGFEALIADTFERQDPRIAERFAKTIGAQIAQMASDISGGPQVAAPNGMLALVFGDQAGQLKSLHTMSAGKDRGICRAIPMLLFHKLRLAWTQWGCKRFESTIQNGRRTTVYHGTSAVEPGCIVFMRNISMKMLHVDKNGRVVRTSDYKVDGHVGHIATVTGCGQIESLAGKGSTYAERAILSLPPDHSKKVRRSSESFDPATLGWLKIVEQALGENGSSDITPRTVLLDMSTFGGKNDGGEMTIYLPMWQKRDVAEADVGKQYPVADGRAFLHIRGLQRTKNAPGQYTVSSNQLQKYATANTPFQPIQMQTGHSLKKDRRNSIQSILSVFS